MSGDTRGRVEPHYERLSEFIVGKQHHFIMVKAHLTFASFKKVNMSTVRNIFLFSYIDRRRKMYLIVLVYFKGFQMWGEAKTLRELNVNSVSLP